MWKLARTLMGSGIRSLPDRAGLSFSGIWRVSSLLTEFHIYVFSFVLVNITIWTCPVGPSRASWSRLHNRIKSQPSAWIEIHLRHLEFSLIWFYPVFDLPFFPSRTAILREQTIETFKFFRSATSVWWRWFKWTWSLWRWWRTPSCPRWSSEGKARSSTLAQPLLSFHNRCWQCKELLRFDLSRISR